MKRVSYVCLSLLLAVPALGQEQVQEFQGKIAKRYEDSVEWWPKSPRPPEGAPNVIIFLLDDVGFAQLGESFGGLIHTPTIDRLAMNGLRTTTSIPRHSVRLRGPR